ncbi:homocysteine S-methyltransferase family protein [Mediterraneibacter sp. NSJ-55]|uniref:Methionine synthase n=1 Tax=Mediterraneibacter hominis TaxID=2763054 RepID=A0A923RPV1_9FIRM|nr:homocysteine S-methyltransferase family protein [Mediterraneibacter hominis]MBC5687993.1 homocysteine S-methyltransferase family protein [Mediterraneibacter hominis]
MIRERLGKELLFFDGGMGTLLQEEGLLPGELPESWNITHPEIIQSIHRKYIEAGSDIILTNTFGANALKFHDDTLSLKAIVQTAVSHVHAAAKEAACGRRIYTALDIGPTGKLLKPMGDLDFETAYEAFKEVMLYGSEAGADVIHIETMSDTYELKAAVLAAKENTALPVFVTTIFDERGKLLTGADVPSVAALLEGLRVDALGINCGMGPRQMLPVLDALLKYTSLPVIVKPNAGLPKQKDGVTYYDVAPEAFADTMEQIVKKGAAAVGGCCGTTPEHIRAMAERCGGIPVKAAEKKVFTVVSSYGQAVFLEEGSKIIGERINPTGKKKFKQALKDHDLDYILKEGIMQQDKGAHILDVNVGLPDIDEPAMMKEVVESLQSVTSLPLQIDTVDTEALETALRIYNGKAMVNSVSGKQESMDQVFPLIAKYGGVVIGLALDENGIPQDAEGRVQIARKIIDEAAKYGIEKKDIVIDALAMTVSSEPEGAKVTLETLRRLRQELRVHTVLGVSNISFGLPSRPVINAAFYTMAMQNGLSAGIINPASEDMMKSWYAYHALMNLDVNCERFIEKYAAADTKPSVLAAASHDMTLQTAIEKGLKEEANTIAARLVMTEEPLSVINEYMIPALNNVGKGFEKGAVFLPQLLMSAEAAKSAFAVLKEKIAEKGGSQEKKEKIVLATVKGDIHDIGKNIVKVLLENYSFEVIDLGKDVPPEKIVKTVCEENIRLAGLSALMTTTVVSMEATIQELRKKAPACKVMVGGAVLNQEYADMIGADFYGKDAMQSVYYAQSVFEKK